MKETALILYKPPISDFSTDSISKSLYAEPYFEEDGCLFMKTSNGQRMLCNFIAYVEEELIVTNGSSEKRI
ncbi:hypothetical protein [Hydrogenoanaerobacterium sp.]|uniref:hypothetical protein n=1 Tax=Hydrogenoanaerobacterium sp. TaxID=2953763 RepID=UPI00289959E0|nr:hypothetical protein [Hydrogenoanaerobacterium sp.]